MTRPAIHGSRGGKAVERLQHVADEPHEGTAHERCHRAAPLYSPGRVTGAPETENTSADGVVFPPTSSSHTHNGPSC